MFYFMGLSGGWRFVLKETAGNPFDETHEIHISPQLQRALQNMCINPAKKYFVWSDDEQVGKVVDSIASLALQGNAECEQIIRRMTELRLGV